MTIQDNASQNLMSLGVMWGSWHAVLKVWDVAQSFEFLIYSPEMSCSGPYATLCLAKVQVIFFNKEKALVIHTRRSVQGCHALALWAHKIWNLWCQARYGVFCWESCQPLCPTGILLSASKFLGRNEKCSFFWPEFEIIFLPIFVLVNVLQVLFLLAHDSMF